MKKLFVAINQTENCKYSRTSVIWKLVIWKLGFLSICIFKSNTQSFKKHRDSSKNREIAELQLLEVGVCGFMGWGSTWQLFDIQYFRIVS